MGGHIQKRGRRWQIDYRDGQGRRHRATFDSRKEADNALTGIKARIGKGDYLAEKSLPKFRELAEDWFHGKADRRPGTVGNWRAHLDLHLNPRLGDLRLDRIDVALIEKLRDELRAKLSARSVNAVLTTAAAVFKLAVRRKLATGNPAADAERAFMGATELREEAIREQRGDGVQPLRPEEVLSPNEIRKLLEKAQPGYYRTLFLTAYLTGMRSGELFALRWSDVELKGIDPETGRECSHGRIYVRRSLSWARVEKDDGPVRPRFFPPKTRAGIRTLPIPLELAGTLRRWKLQCPPSENELAFPMIDGQPMRRSTALRCGLWPALSRAGLRRVNMHSLRHSFASALIMAGAPVTEVQSLLGHSSPAVTLKVYSHWFTNVETNSVDRLAQGLMTASKNLGHFLDTFEVAPKANTA
jgi:integrase